MTPRVTRREAILGLSSVAAGAAIGAAAGVGAALTIQPEGATPERGKPVEPSGPHQAGIARPLNPQRSSLTVVIDVDTAAEEWLGDVGAVIRELVAARTPRVAALLPDGAGDLTVLIGLGSRVSADAAAVLGKGLPQFAQDEGIAARDRDGDVMIQACASDPSILDIAVADVAAAIPGARIRWAQRGFRPPGDSGIVRNPIGFLDGIIVPRGGAALSENVWIDSGPFAGGTVCVLRRLRLDTAGFRTLQVEAQEAVIGRRRSDGAPLTGGSTTDEVDLRAKTPEGEFVTPARSHARAAHPSFSGSDLMLRRGYAFDNGIGEAGPDAGLLFVCFQRSLRTFVATQQRLDEVDDLMRWVTPTASAAFAIVPGAVLHP